MLQGKLLVKGSPFKEVQLKNLTKQLPRLDQLVWFQDEYDGMPSVPDDINELLKRSNLVKADFLYQHALQYSYDFFVKL